MTALTVPLKKYQPIYILFFAVSVALFAASLFNVTVYHGDYAQAIQFGLLGLTLWLNLEVEHYIRTKVAGEYFKRLRMTIGYISNTDARHEVWLLVTYVVGGMAFLFGFAPRYEYTIAYMIVGPFLTLYLCNSHIQGYQREYNKAMRTIREIVRQIASKERHLTRVKTAKFSKGKYLIWIGDPGTPLMYNFDARFMLLQTMGNGFAMVLLKGKMDAQIGSTLPLQSFSNFYDFPEPENFGLQLLLFVANEEGKGRSNT